MPDLQKIGQTINSLAPDTMYLYIVQNFMANDQLLNLLPFVPQGGQLMAGSGRWQINIPYADEPVKAVNRKLFQEPEAQANYTNNVTVTLREIAQVFPTDRSLQRMTSTGPITSWEALQIQMATRSVINKFNYDFINGVNSDTTEQFDGLLEYFKKHPGQSLDALDIDVLSKDNALMVEQFLDYCMSHVRGGANAILTTRLGGSSFLRALETHRNRGIVEVVVGSKQYKTFMGVKVVELEDNMFTPETLAKGIPFIFIHIDEMMDGVRVVIPAVGPILEVIEPGKQGTINGVFTSNGGVSMISVPILVDPYCASMTFVKQAKGPGGQGNA